VSQAWTPFGVSVAFEDSVCTSSVPLSCAFNMSLSQYAIRVWVVGPVGSIGLKTNEPDLLTVGEIEAVPSSPTWNSHLCRSANNLVRLGCAVKPSSILRIN
jgi:hypothetical protein